MLARFATAILVLFIISVALPTNALPQRTLMGGLGDPESFIAPKQNTSSTAALIWIQGECVTVLRSRAARGGIRIFVSARADFALGCARCIDTGTRLQATP